MIWLIKLDEKKIVKKGFKISISNSSTRLGINPNLINEPILIPLARLFREGKPPGNLYPIILEHDKNYFYFGTVCITKEWKIIFFPGLRNLKIIDYENKMFGILEHVTIDEDFSKGHVKCQDRNVRLSNLHITKKKSYYFWFNLSINSLKNLDQKHQGELTISIPKTDKERRKEEIIKAYNNTDVENLPFFDIGSEPISNNEFLSFDFIFTDKKGEDFYDISLFSTIAKPIKENRIKCNAYILDLKDISKRLLIICSILEKFSADVISDNRPRFFFLQKT